MQRNTHLSSQSHQFGIGNFMNWIHFKWDEFMHRKQHIEIIKIILIKRLGQWILVLNIDVCFVRKRERERDEKSQARPCKVDQFLRALCSPWNKSPPPKRRSKHGSYPWRYLFSSQFHFCLHAMRVHYYWHCHGKCCISPFNLIESSTTNVKGKKTWLALTLFIFIFLLCNNRCTK